MRKKLSFFIALCTILCSIALFFPVSGVSASSGITWNTVKVNKPTTTHLSGITWGNNAFIAVGYNGTILKSADGDAWEQKTSGTNIDLNNVIWDGIRYIVVGENGTILTSIDGESWTTKSSGITSNLNGVAWNGNKLVAVGDSGIIITSEDGDLWTQRTSGVTNDLNNVTWGNNCFLVSEKKGALISTNGIDWSFKAPKPGELDIINFYDAIWDGSKFVSVGSMAAIASSSDCINWKYNCWSTGYDLFGIAYSGKKYVSVGANGDVYFSTDGISWSWSGRDSSTSNSLYDVAWNGSKFVAVGSEGTIIQSDNGETWYTYYEQHSGYFYDIVYNGSKFVAVGTPQICVSADGINWISINRMFTELYGVTWGNGLFVAVGKEGCIKTSPDGIHWTSRSSGTSKTLEKVIWQGTQFIAVGGSGTMLTSPDGITWTSVDSGLTVNLNGIVYGLGQYVVVGDSDFIATSPNGMAWTKQNPGTSHPSYISNDFDAVTYNGNQYVVVGDAGTILTSPDGVIWTERESGTNQEFHDIIWNGNWFVAAGYWQTTAISQDGITWVSTKTSTPDCNQYTALEWGANKFVLVCDLDYIKYAAEPKYVASIQPISISTTAGTAPILPTEVTAQYNDNTAANLTVTWDSIDSAQYEKTGTFTVKGTVNDTPKQAIATVTVNPATISVTGVTLDNAAITLTAGGSKATLTAAVAPDNATNTAVTWSSSNENVATVANGVITPISAGTATITVTTVDGSKKASCDVTVNPATISVTGVTLDNTALTLTAGGSKATLTAAVAPDNATNKAVTWSSSNENVATVANGVITPISAGTATITATTVDGSKKASCDVTVNPATISVTGVTLDNTALTLTAGGSKATLTAAVAPDNATNKAVTWSSSNENVATVANGVITPIAAGTATITVTTADGSKKASCDVTVNPATISVTGVTLNNTALTLTAGGSKATLTAAVAPDNATNKAVTWSSSNENVATVANGVITPISAGTATITVTTADGSKKASCDVTVNPAAISVTGVTLNNTALTLTAGGSKATLTAAVVPDNATNKAVTWSSSNENVATVVNGVITPIAAGTATITATTADGSKKASCLVKVESAPDINSRGNIKGKVTDGTNPIDGASVSMNIGGHSYSAITTSDGNYAINDVPAGTGYTITASKAGFTPGNVLANVIANTTNLGIDIILTPSNINIKISTITVTCEGGDSEVAKGKTLQMSVLVSPVTVKNPTVTWSVENGTGSATISSTGLLTATDVGTVSVRATANDGSGVSGIKTITIINASTDSGNIPPSGGSGNTVPPSGGSGNSIPPSGGPGGNLPVGVGLINSGIPAESTSITTDATTSIKGTTAIATTIAQATTDTKGGVAVTVTNAQITEAVTKAVKEATKLGKDGKAAVIITVKAADNTASISTTIPKTAVSTVVENEIGNLTITTPVVTVTFDDAALEAINKKADGDIAIKLMSLDGTKLSDEDKAKVGNRPVYDFSLTSGTKAITNFGGGKAFISIPYTLKVGENSDNIVIYYLDNGKFKKVTHCTYKQETKSIDFETTHFSSYAVGYSTVGFTDVSGWYANSVNYLAARGIINGKGSNGFAPNANITRAEFVSILANLADVDLSQYKDSVFGDVETTSWCNGAIQWAYENGLVAGSNGNFSPNANITRQDMAVIIANYSKKIENHTLSTEKEAVNFADSSEISSYAKNAVKAMQQACIISGKGSNTFAPRANATRAEAAAMIAELLRGIVE